MEVSYLEILGCIVVLLLFSRRIFDLSLSIFITSSTILASLIAISVSTLILAVASIPTLLVGCKVAENIYADSATPQPVMSVCGIKAKTPKMVRSRNITFSKSSEVYYPSARPTSAPGKY